MIIKQEYADLARAGPAGGGWTACGWAAPSGWLAPPG